jgi:hypothetical protein
MTETNNELGIFSVQGILNWIFLLMIFSIITAIGNYLGYRHPISESLIGMGILSLIALLGAWMEKNLPLKIPAIVYVIFIGVTLALPLMPTSDIVIYYVSEVEIISLVTVFLAYVGIGMGNRWSEIKALNWKGVIVSMLIVSFMYIGSALAMQLV